MDNPALNQFSFEDIYFRSSDGLTLHGWYIKSKKEKLGTILQFHGNAQNISTHVNSILWLALEGYDIFTFDYRGYGKSEGYPTLDGIHKDATSALKTAIKLNNDSPIFVLGQSLGGAIAVYTAANFNDKHRIKALIIDSAFISYRSIVKEKLSSIFIPKFLQYPFLLLFEDYYSVKNWIKDVSPIPLLIIQGDKDVIVPPHHAIEIFGKADEPKELWLIKDAGHIGSLGKKEVRERLLKYLADIK